MMARPREFDREDIVAKITNLFWERGFKGTSLDDIVKATGLKRGSLYSCFGNKEKLFLLAIEHYSARGPFGSRLGDSTVDTLCIFYSRLIAEANLPGDKRRGCLIFNSCLEFGNKPTRLASVVIKQAKKTELFFRKIVEEAQAKGEIPQNIDTVKAAQRIFAAAFTIREMAKFKPETEFLREIANSALASLGTDKHV
jgi:TetR/AcrR family transcriptional repressor of nem operon